MERDGVNEDVRGEKSSFIFIIIIFITPSIRALRQIAYLPIVFHVFPGLPLLAFSQPQFAEAYFLQTCFCVLRREAARC